MYHSVNFDDDHEAMVKILDLHGSGDLLLDATFGHGGFWRNGTRGHRTGYQVVGLDRNVDQLVRLRSDLLAKADAATRNARAIRDLAAGTFSSIVGGNYERTPFPDRIFNAIVFDPPFFARSGPKGIMGQRFGTFPTYADILISLQRAKNEFVRLLRPKGIVVAKAQDYTEGRQRRNLHVDLVNSWAPDLRLDDLMVCVGKSSVRNPAWHSQSRFRSSHTYFMIFKVSRSARQQPAGAG